MQGDLLKGLNSAQLKAATYPPNTSLQILAGPGSGKTRVLTTRIAHLITNCHLPPNSICAVTFTNKAANEMKERLTKLLGKERTAQLKLGTFHSLCARFLRKYSKQVSVPDNFTVCDAGESKKMITSILKEYSDTMAHRGLSLEPSACASMISKAKSRGQSAKDYLSDALIKSSSKETDEPATLEVLVGKVYQGYEAALRRINALDFDDLLIYGVKLFTTHKECVLWCRHILVDEFQDTNVTQYELMLAIGTARCVTIVGDPDQSIYGWRSAEVKNLEKMRTDFPNTFQIFLEENYRSTASILEASLAIRINKSLYTAHPSGITPILYQVNDENEESRFIAIEIKRLVANMGGILRWGDFSILLRYNALSRNLEKAFQNERIPCRILGGHKFFERLEVKDLLAYLQLIDNPIFGPAFIRVVNVPGRGIGEKTLNDLTKRAEDSGKSYLELLEGIYDMRLTDQKPSVRKKIAPFVHVIRTLRAFQYEEHLKKTQQDWETRWENVKELISFAKEIEEQMAKDREAARASGVIDELEVEDTTPLRQFLQASMLSSEGDNESEEDANDKVTITTCHSAKGLEWPVVFIPSADSSTYPFIRSEDEDEERRLLYVACTRAKSMLYLTRTTSRKVAGDVKQKQLSKFIANILDKNHKDGKRATFIQHLPHFEEEDREIISSVLGRPTPEDNKVQEMLGEFLRLGREVPYNIVWRPASQNDPSPQPSVQHSHMQFPQQTFDATFTRPTFNPEPTFSRPSFNTSMPSLYRPNVVTPFSTNEQGRATNSAPAPAPKPKSSTSKQGQETQKAPSNMMTNWLGQKPKSKNQSSTVTPSVAGPSRQYHTNKPKSHASSLPSHPVQPPTSIPPTSVSSSKPERPPTSTSSSLRTNASLPSNTVTTISKTPLQMVSNQPRPTVTPANPPPALNITNYQASNRPTAVASGTLAATGVKRRLGVGRATAGYSNKKFKPPVASTS
ncbi:ATP-dependent DNA helicase pcra [Coprinopsis cinerea okayama7|uniref:DNA 3'-5' helicase n=1 Tax=Coprinopsis cinerea (strain Okayama-7 / 130 / ATCC MYA-4618 / FGSC 9003) TaxID=240176 RepID=D6RM91_COPC7|nr:ATP-dependent DNA helicase pcra [Coprinopsis cinerea okayama7\|eukprot:XP_002911398.1 ATP-dependent DNA helicase pcra [Coprinopsis cinerea okayama7\